MATHFIQKYDSTAAFLAASVDNNTAEAFGVVSDVLYQNIGGEAVPVSGRGRVETVTATNILTAAESGKTTFLSSATEFVSTLPAPAAGLKFSFVVAAAPSGASYTIVTHDGSDLIHGVAASAADAGGSVDSTSGTPADTITFVDGQALVGDRIDVISDGTYWYAFGLCADEDAITFSAS